VRTAFTNLIALLQRVLERPVESDALDHCGDTESQSVVSR
jgi:hypothetical protein